MLTLLLSRLLSRQSLVQIVTRFTVGLIILPVLIPLCADAISQPAQSSARRQNEVRKLKKDKPGERDLRGDESHTYEIALRANQYLHAVVAHRGINVVVTVMAPDGKPLLELDSLHGKEGEETVELVAEKSGDYQITVRALDKQAASGRYTIRVAEIRDAKDWDRTLVSVKTLNLPAERLRRQGNYDQALLIGERALAIAEKGLGSQDPEIGVLLNNLALSHMEKSDYAKAEPLLLRALAIREKTFDAEHPQIAQTLNNLALLYTATGAYGKAEPLYRRALTIREKVLGAEHPDVALSLNNFAISYWKKGDVAQAITYQQRSNEVSERDLMRNLAGGSERQKLIYLNQLSERTFRTLSLHLQAAPNRVAARNLAITALLQRKGRALDAMTDTISSLRHRASSEDRALLEQLAEARTAFSSMTLKGAEGTGQGQYRATLQRLEDRLEKLESQISQRSAAFRAHATPITLEAVQAAIPESAALVEFVFYKPYDVKKDAFGEPRYAAYLLRNNGNLQWVDLGEAKPINAACATFRKALSGSAQTQVKLLARALDGKVMQPIRSLLGETTRIFLSPDGALNLIPFAALVDEQSRFLVERYSITYLSSGRDLLRLQAKKQNAQVPVIIADPDFNKAAQESSAKPADQNTKRGLSTGKAGLTRPKLGELAFDPLERLPATVEEAREVKKTLPDASVRMGSEATEAALKLVASPLILHIATHGFFLEDQTVSKETRGLGIRPGVPTSRDEALVPEAGLKNPLLRSGLFFAGVNTGQSGNEDGVLTALEASGLDLWGTKLVVLSACDTGVGEVKSGEGVYGLRRALVLAGSESQVMSLWPVSDEGTRELMVEYYRRLKAGEGRSQALRNVQLKMLASPNRQHPFYWASFIQSGEWANLDGVRK